MKIPPRPLAPHVQKCLNKPAAQVQGMMPQGRVPAPHVQSAVQRCHVPVLQARTIGVVPLPPRAIQQARRPGVIQRSKIEEVSFEFKVEKDDSSRKPSGIEVKMDGSKGTEGYALAGLYTREVRNCVVLCMFSSPALKPLQKIYLHHTPWYETLPEAALKVAESWGVEFKSCIIGGNNKKYFEENISSGAWKDLNIVRVVSPLTEEGFFANVEINKDKITYWIHDDSESTTVFLV
jgi:hypothetical protein